MCESPDFSFREIEPDEVFDEVEERVAPSACIPFSYNGANLMITPDNAIVRLFLEGGPDAFLASKDLDIIDKLEIDIPSRIIFKFDDGTEAPLKKDDMIRSMVKGGFLIMLPKRPDESDEEFAKLYMELWSEDASQELGLSL